MDRESAAKEEFRKKFYSTTAEHRLSVEDREVIKKAFKGNRPLFDALKRVFLPAYNDPENPWEFTGADVLSDQLELNNIPVDEFKGIVAGRSEAIKLVSGGLRQVWTIAEDIEESASQMALRRAKDSAK